MNSILAQCIDNLEEKWLNVGYPSVNHYDVVLDGGAFNGSYTLGSLFYLRELEHRNHICVDRISGISVGSIMGMLFLADKLDLGVTLYSSLFGYFKESGTLRILKRAIRKVVKTLDDTFYLTCNDRLFISYVDCKHNKHVTQHKYESNADLANAIIKSSFVPFLVNGTFTYKHQYVDGTYPYVFQKRDNTIRLYVDLTHDIFSMLHVKHEVNNGERIVKGILDIHFLFFRGFSKHMCSFIDDWGYMRRTWMYTRVFVSDVVIWCIYFCMRTLHETNTDAIKHVFSYLTRMLMTTFCV